MSQTKTFKPIELHALIKPQTLAALIEATEWALSEWDGLPSHAETTAKWRAARQEAVDIITSRPNRISGNRVPDSTPAAPDDPASQVRRSD